MTMTLAKLVLDGQEVYAYEVDFVTCLDENNQETEDCVNAYQYAVNLNDDGHERLDTAEIYVTRDELDAETHELLLEFIQPT
ncbi:MAG: hypothetical protein HEQ10_03460 [Dolichospermum sp. DEX182a]|nr:hypothetical protein [Dolichospermum sp. DEX182a]